MIARIINRMRLWVKIGAGYFVIGLFLLACGFAGIWGLGKLGGSLDYIIGPAWETADGSMETRTGVQGQMIAAEYIVADVQAEEYRNILTAARNKAQEASNRMIDAGVIDASQQTELRQKLSDYEAELEALLASYATFLRPRGKSSRTTRTNSCFSWIRSRTWATRPSRTWNKT